LTTVYYFFTKTTLRFTKTHLDGLFRTVSRGSWVPRGPFPEGSEGWRGLRKVEEGWRRLRKVGEGQGKLEKV